MKTRDQYVEDFNKYQIQIFERTGLSNLELCEMVNRHSKLLWIAYLNQCSVDIVAEEIKEYELNLAY